MRWPKDHLTWPKPSLFFVFFGGGGFKGQVRSKGPPHLALNHPYFFVFCVFLCFPFFAFLSLLLVEQTLFPPPKKKSIFVYFFVSLYFSLAFCWPPPFHGLFLGLSLSLSLSLSFSLLLFFFFLPSCFPCQFLVLAFCFCFVCFLFQDVVLLLLFCLLSCFVLNHNNKFVFVLHLVFLLLLFFVLLFGYFFLATYQKTSLEQLDIAKKTKMKNAEKWTFLQEQLAQVCSQIVSYFLCVLLYNLHALLKTLYKYCV